MCVCVCGGGGGGEGGECVKGVKSDHGGGDSLNRLLDMS